MSRMYTVQFYNIAVIAIQDIFEVTAAAGKPIEIAGIELGQTTDVGDAAEEILALQFISGNTTSGSGGAAVTPEPIVTTDPAAGFLAERNNDTVAIGGTEAIHHTGLWNIRQSYIWIPPLDMRIMLTGGERLVVNLPAAPADSITCSGTLYVNELG